MGGQGEVMGSRWETVKKIGRALRSPDEVGEGSQEPEKKGEEGSQEPEREEERGSQEPERVKKRRLYLITHFKILSDDSSITDRSWGYSSIKREVYGGKTFEGTLDRCVKRLLKMYGPQASVKVLGEGWYSVDGGRAEMREIKKGS
jgi:hypothetical protein